MLESLVRDLRFTIRMLAARPGWSAAAILCLAIATGANTSAFSLVNGLLLRPLPFDEPDRLVMVALHEPAQTRPRPFALREYRELERRSGSTATLLARTFFPLSLADDHGARMEQAELVSGNYFETLRVRPFLGRFFDASVDRQGSPPLAVASYRLWRRRFGSDPGAVGRTVRVNGRPVVIAGVAPEGFVGAMQLVAADLWLPAAMYPDLAGSDSAADVPMFGVIGRLLPEIAPEQAAARLTAATATLELKKAGAAPSVITTPARGFGVPVAVAGMVRSVSAFAYVTMALLMAVACANVAALVLARSTGRAREIAMRLSLGATRRRIVRQLLIESLVLAIAGCAAGALLGIWMTQAFVARLMTPFQYVNYAIDVHPDYAVIGYAAMATAVAVVLCGIAPIRIAGRVDVVDVLKQATARGHSRQTARTLNSMVVVQFAVSTALLVAAGLLVRAYANAQATHAAFETAGLVAATLDVDQARLDRPTGVRVYDAMMQRLSALPGVTGVALTRDLSLEPSAASTVVADGDARDATSRRETRAAALVASPQYFRTLGLRLREGRVFDDRKREGPAHAVIDETLAQRLWPTGSAVGRTFRLNLPNAESIEVIGVVSNLAAASLSHALEPAFYRPFPQVYGARMTMLLRVQDVPARVFPEIRRIVRDVNPDLSVVDLRLVQELIDLRSAQRRTPAAALVLVAMFGLLLSAVGLYGVVAYSVRGRTHELGVRLALGARPADIRRLVLQQGMAIVAAGFAAGSGAAFALTQVLRRTVFAVGAIDPALLGVICTVLVGSALAALYFPARWASGLEPAQTLRTE